MSVVADLSVPTDQFALRDTLAAAPRVTVEFERVVTHSQEWIMPFLWVSGEDFNRFDREVHDDETVTDAVRAEEFEQDEFPDVGLYRIRWNADIKQAVNTIFDREGTLVEAVANQNRWDLKVRFEEHASLSTLQSHFGQANVDFVVKRVYSPTKPRQPEFNVTPGQRDVLVVALENGYFDVPRQTTMSEIATELDVSTTAVSERLRRGIANLVETTLTVQDSLDKTNGSDP